MFSWGDSRTAFGDAAGWFVRTAALVGDRWDQPGLGEWDVRALVGHTSRALLTVETYLARPAAAVDVATPPDYFRATSAAAADAAVAARGRDAGTALGSDPAAAVAGIAARVLALVATRNGTEVVATIAGGMRLGDAGPGDGAARRDVQPRVLHRHPLRDPRGHLRAAPTGLPWLPPDPDTPGRVLPHAATDPRHAGVHPQRTA